MIALYIAAQFQGTSSEGTHFHRVLSGFVNAEGFHEILPASERSAIPLCDDNYTMASVLVDGEIRRGYLLNRHVYAQHIEKLGYVVTHMTPLLDHVILRGATVTTAGTCVICQEEKQVQQLCKKCRNFCVCGSCCPTFYQSQVMQADTSEFEETDSPKVFECSMCRHVHRLNDITVDGSIILDVNM